MIGHAIQVDFWFDDDCPNAALVRARLAESLEYQSSRWTLREHQNAGVLSPTVTVNGEDVMRGAPPRGRGCRLDLPTVQRITRALEPPKEGNADD